MRRRLVTVLRRPHHRWGIALLLLTVLLASLPPSPGGVAVDAGPSAPASVTDPIPAPGAVVPAGPTLIAARVHGAAPDQVTFLVDGQRAAGRHADPDGQLSDRRGLEVSLAPGVHEVAVEVAGQGVVRSWPVRASGLAVELAPPDPLALGIRTSGGRSGPRPVVLANPDEPASAIAAGPLAVALDALLLPSGRDGLGDRAWAELLAQTEAGGGVVVLLGGADVIGDAMATGLTNAGLTVVRLSAAGPAELAAQAAAYVAGLGSADRSDQTDPTAIVVGPLLPIEEGLRTAAAATSLGATPVLVTPLGLPLEAVERLGQAKTVLASTAMTPVQRDRVGQALGPEAVISDEALLPRRAAEALLVADGVDPGAIAFAVRGSHPNRAVVIGSAAAREWVATHRPDRVTLIGADDAASELAQLLGRDWIDGPDAPAVEGLVDTREGLTVTYTADAPVSDASVHVDLLGYEWPGTVSVQDRTITWVGAPRPRLPEALEPAEDGTPARIDLTAVITTADGTRHLQAVSQALISPLTSRSGEGFVVAGGTSGVVGSGPLVTFSVEVEPSTGLDIVAVAAEVEQILLDPRGWTADGTRSLQRVGTSRAADLRVVVAHPQTVDYHCGQAGLRTGGRVSCWDGFRAMLNLIRWNTGVVPFHSDVAVYRQYLVNHEVGHGLGYGHVLCPGPGALAPVMMQQTGGLRTCQPNGWPYPTFGTTPAVG